MFREKKANKIVAFILIAIVTLIFIFPIIWTFRTSFLPPDRVTDLPPSIIFKPTFENYIRAWNSAKLGEKLINSLIISVSSTVIVIAVGFFAAYSFSRYNTGGGHILYMILTTRMFPAAAIVIPYFLIFQNLGLIDKHLGLILAHVMFNLPFAVFIMYGFFKDIPADLEYCAMMDGYSRGQIFQKIILPLALPGVMITASFCLLFSWNEFLLSFILTRFDARTITAGIEQFWTAEGIKWGPLTAAVSIAITPMLAMVIFMQKYIVRGLTFGAVKQ
jgi:multiple sugar transport system permease protein